MYLYCFLYYHDLSSCLIATVATYLLSNGIALPLCAGGGGLDFGAKYYPRESWRATASPNESVSECSNR